MPTTIEQLGDILFSSRFEEFYNEYIKLGRTEKEAYHRIAEIFSPIILREEV